MKLLCPKCHRITWQIDLSKVPADGTSVPVPCEFCGEPVQLTIWNDQETKP